MAKKIKIPYDISMELIGPNDAVPYLKQNDHNRPLSEMLSDRYAASMKGNEWIDCGDSIRFNCDGTLIDGQHRLYAIIKSGVTIPMLVIRGLPKETFKQIDAGKVRTNGDSLAADGESHYNQLAASIRWLGVIAGRRSWKQMAVSRKKLFDVLKNNPKLRDSAAYILHVKAQTICSSGILTACHYVFAKLDQAMADKFLLDLGGGEGLKRTDPVYVLRERLRRSRTDRETLPPDCIAAFVIKAWNATRKGEVIKKLVWQSEEAFPKVQ